MKKNEQEKEELQEELAEEARDEQEDIAADDNPEEGSGSDAAGAGEKILETVELPTEEINAALKKGEDGQGLNLDYEPLDSGRDQAAEEVPADEEFPADKELSADGSAEGAEDAAAANAAPEDGEKILETVELPTDEINAAAEQAERASEGSSPETGKDSSSSSGEKTGWKKKTAAVFAAAGSFFRRMKVWQRIVFAVVCVIVVLGLAGYGYFHSKYILMDYNTGEFHSEDDLASEESSQDEMENEELAKRQETEQIEERSAVESTGEVETSTGVVNILLIGTDDRTKTFSTNARGDTCILLSINRDKNEAHLVSFERATGVKVLSGQYEGQWDWLTHMFWYGGPAMMTDEIRENFKVDVTKYIRVNIYTLMELLDSIDGIDVELTQAEADNINHPGNTYTAGNEARAIKLGYTVQTDLVAGMNHLDAGTAVVYARLRAIDDDWHRVERQRKVILAAIDKLKTMSLTELDSLLNNVLPLVQTNLTESDVAGLLPEALTFVNMNYDSITFPLRHTYGLMDGMQGRKVLAVDFDTNAQELQNLLYGDVTAEELTAKYENTPTEYNYKSSTTYQQNYQDAESVAGTVSGTEPFQEGDTGTAGGAAGLDTETGTDAASGQPDPSAALSADGTETSGSATSTDAAASGGTSGGLGEVEATTTDPETGVVTTTYYNKETGVRTSVAIHPASGASTVSITDTNSGETTTVHKDADGTTTTETGAASAAETGSAGAASTGASNAGTASTSGTAAAASAAASTQSTADAAAIAAQQAAAQQAAIAAQQAALAAQQAAAQQTALAAQQAAAQ